MDEALKKVEDYLLSDQFKSLIEKSLKELVDEQFKQQNKKIDALIKTFDLKAEQWSEDRSEISQNTILLKTVKALLESIQENNNDQTKEIVTKIHEELGPVQEDLTKNVQSTVEETITNQMHRKKTVFVIKQGIFSRFFNRIKGVRKHGSK